MMNKYKIHRIKGTAGIFIWKYECNIHNNSQCLVNLSDLGRYLSPKELRINQLAQLSNFPNDKIMQILKSFDVKCQETNN